MLSSMHSIFRRIVCHNPKWLQGSLTALNAKDANDYTSGPLLLNSEIPVVQQRRFASAQRKEESRHVVQSKDKPYSELSTVQKVKQAGTDATYTGVVIVGIGVTGLLFYAIGRELFSSQSPSGVYNTAYKKCKKHQALVDAVGLPMKGYGEMTRRGRRRHVSHQYYERDGHEFMRVKFYIEGPFKKGTAHTEVKKNESNKWEFRYLFVELDDYPPRTFVIEDNR